MLSGDCSITSGACGREEKHSEEAVGSHAEEAALAGPNPLPAAVQSAVQRQATCWAPFHTRLLTKVHGMRL